MDGVLAPLRSRRLWLASFTAWTAVGLLILAQLALGTLSAHMAFRPHWAGPQLLTVWMWAALTPSIFALSNAFPIAAPRWLRRLLLQLGLSLLVTAVDAWLYNTALHLLGWSKQRYVECLLDMLFIDVYSYFAVLGVAHAVAYHRLYVERKLRASELETELTRAQLQTLQMQLRPHFLFNTLNTISAMVRLGHPETAVRMLAGLGDLLRAVLRVEGAQQVPLRQEVAFVERYLAIEKLRFQDRLAVELEVDPDLLDVPVPSLVLQPLVENAVRHGTNQVSGRVAIQIRAEGEMLWIRVRDSGTGPREASGGHGVGLGNTRARLTRLYGTRHHFELTQAEGGGAMASVAIPLQGPQLTRESA